MSETLLLEAKGPIRPAPALAGHAQAVSLAIQSWPGVISATHWHLYRPTQVDGADFYVGAAECGHIHLGGEVHLATSGHLSRLLLANGLARRFPYYASWVEADIGSPAQAEHAIWLFRLNYDRLTGTGEAELEARIVERAGLQNPVVA